MRGFFKRQTQTDPTAAFLSEFAIFFPWENLQAKAQGRYKEIVIAI